MKYLLISLGFIFFCFSGCKKSNNPVDPPENIPFDLSLGKTWVYGWSAVLTDSTGNVAGSETDTFQVRITSIHDTLKNFIGLIRFEAQSISHFIGVTKVWYQFAGDSLVEIAYNNAGATPVVLPKQSSKATRRVKNDPPVFSLFPKSVRSLMKLKGFEDSVILRNDIRIVYQFPLSIGKTWTSFTAPFLETREVIGSEMLERAGKNFSCAKIKTMIPELSPDIEWYDDVANDGLIERQITIPFEVTTINNPDGTGEKMLSTEKLTLISN